MSRSESDLTPDVYVERPTAQLKLSERVLKDLIRRNKKNLVNKSIWVTPFGILIALLFTRVTATFKEALGISAEIWVSLCTLAIIGMICWLGYSIYLCIRAKSTDKIIEELKNEDLVRVTY